MDNREKSRRHSEFKNLVNLRGKRYEQCRFANFTATTNDQKAARDAIVRYANDLAEHLDNGTNLILFGPRGTGKDHLLFGLMHTLIREYPVEMYNPIFTNKRDTLQWGNGVSMFAELRDTFDSRHTSERNWIRKYAKPTVLAISDPLPPQGNLTDFQMAALLDVLDIRYSHMRPTWVTVNVADGAELDERLGPQAADRLRDGAVAVHCNWASYRKARP